MGTLSAPVCMLAAQWVATRQLLRGARSPSDRVLGLLGATMVAGYFAEALVRRRLRPSSFDVVETPLLAIAIALSGAMTVLGLTSQTQA
jgi:hypothetical protein